MSVVPKGWIDNVDKTRVYGPSYRMLMGMLMETMKFYGVGSHQSHADALMGPTDKTLVITKDDNDVYTWRVERAR